MKWLSVLLAVFLCLPVLGQTATEIAAGIKREQADTLYLEVQSMRSAWGISLKSSISQSDLDTLTPFFTTRALTSLSEFITANGSITHWRMFSETWFEDWTPPKGWGPASLVKLSLFFELQDEKDQYNNYPVYILFLQSDFPKR